MRPGWTGADVRAAEQPFLEQGRGPALMATAARALAMRCRRLLRERRGRLAGARAVLLAGKGNNGGDGLWAAADLRRAGVSVTAIPTADRLHEEGARALREAGGIIAERALDEDGIEAALELMLGADLVLDAVLGTGASGGLRGPVADLAQALGDRLGDSRGRGPIVVAVDLPSGLGADGGPLEGPVLPARCTVTFGAAKAAQLCAPGDRVCGELVLAPIGLEDELPLPAALRLEDADLDALWPRPDAEDHKYTRGVVGVVAGSADYPGAALLTVRAAQAAGTGMVRYLGDESTQRLVNLTAPEAVVSDQAPSEAHVQAWIAGPGAVDEAQRRRVREVIDEALDRGIPAVLDAGALETAGRCLADRRLRPWIVLSPHAGEMAELLAWCEAWGLLPQDAQPPQREQIEADPGRWARIGAEATGATILLKGATTVIAAPSAEGSAGAEAAAGSEADDGHTSRAGSDEPGGGRGEGSRDSGRAPLVAVGTGSPWLATAGSGDTLSGMIGTLLAHDAGRPERLEGSLGPWLEDAGLPGHLVDETRQLLTGPGRWALLAGVACTLQGRASRARGEGPQPALPEDIRAALTRPSR